MRDREREKRERQRQMAPRMTRTERTWASPVGWLKGDPEEPPPPTSQDHTEKKGTRGLLNASSSQDLEDKKLPKLPEQWKDAALVVVLDFLGRYGYKSAALALENESGIQLEELSEDMILLRAWVTKGNWSSCYEYLRNLRSGQNVISALSEMKKQAFFELLSRKDRPTPVSDLVTALEDIEKTCTTDCFNEACYCMSLKEVQDHPPCRDWTKEKGRISCFEKVKEYLSGNPVSKQRDSVFESCPQLETILRRSRAWLEHHSTVSNSAVFDHRENNEAIGVDHVGEHADITGGSTDKLIDVCDRLNKKAELLTQSQSSETFKQDNEEGLFDPEAKQMVEESGLLKEKMRDISNARQGRRHSQSRPGSSHDHHHHHGHQHHHDLPCSPGYLAKPKNSPQKKQISPQSSKRRSRKPRSPSPSPPPSGRRRCPLGPSSPVRSVGGKVSPSDGRSEGGERSQSLKQSNGGGGRTSVSRALNASFDDTIPSSTEIKIDKYGSSNISRGFVSQEVFRDSHPIRCLSFCEGTSFAALGCNNEKALRVFQMHDSNGGGRLEEIFIRRKHHDGSIYCMELKKVGDSYLVATGSNDHQVKVLSTFDFRGDSTATFSGHNGTVRDLSISSSGKLLATGGAGDNAVRLWDIKKQRCVGELYSHESMITGVCFRKTDEHAYMSSDSSGHLFTWDARLEKCSSQIKELRPGQVSIASLAVSGSYYVGIGHVDGCFQILDIRNAKPVFEKFIHSKECRSLDFSPDDKWLLSTSFDCMSHVVSVGDGSLLCSSRGHSDRIVQGKWNPSKVQYATCSVDGTVQVYRPRQPLLVPDCIPM